MVHPANRGGAPLILLTLVAFVLIPGVLVFRLIDHLEEAAGFRHRQERAALGGAILQRVALMGTPERRFERKLERLSRIPLSPIELARRAGNLVRSEAGALELLVFDAAGEPVPLPGFPRLPRAVHRRFFEALISPGNPSARGVLTSIGGNPNVGATLAANPQALVRTGNVWSKAWGGWWKVRSLKGKVVAHLIGFVNLDRVDRVGLFDRAVTEVSRLIKGQFHIGWLDPADPERPRPFSIPWPATFSAAVARAPLGCSEWLFEGHDVVFLDGPRGQRLFSLDVSGPPRERGFPALKVGMALFLGVLGVFVFLGDAGFLGGLQIRGKLVLLLLVGTGILSGGLLVNAILDRENRETKLIDDFQVAHLEFLGKIDKAFSREVLRCLEPFETFISAARTMGDPAFIRNLERLDEIMADKDRSVAAVICMDLERKPLFRKVARSSYVLGGKNTTEEIITSWANDMLDGLDLVPKAERLKKPLDPIAAGDGMPEIFFWQHRRQGRFSKQTFFEAQFLIFTDMIYRPDGTPRALLLSYFDRQALERRFLRGFFATFRKTSGDEQVRLAAIPTTMTSFLRAFPNRRTIDNVLLRGMADRVLLTQIPFHSVGTVSGRDYLLTANRGANLEDFILIAARPFDLVRKGTRALYLRLGAFAALMVILGVLSAWLASTQLLPPLAQLGTALSAVEKRNFRKYFKVEGIDELVRIGDRLKLVMDDLNDLKIARTVQEHLWPKEPLRGDGWEMHGACRTSANLGGDFFDWFSLPDGRVIFALGDVAGHGIPAAIVAALAKTSLVVGAEALDGPAEILDFLNQEFVRQAGRRKPMGLWLGVFQPALWRLRFAVAGHSFGVHLPPGGNPEFLGTVGYPLGARKDSTYREMELQIGPGVRLLLYSDGIVEALNQRLEPFGYDRLFTEAEGFRSGDPAAAVQALLESAARWSGLETPLDDQTVLLFCRHPSQKTEANE